MKTFKILIKIVLTATLAYSFQSVGAWWTVAVAGFLISLIISSNGISSFIGGFLGVALLWFITAFARDVQGDSILTAKVAEIFSLPNTFLLILVTAIIGGIVGGMGALLGSHLRSIIMPAPKAY